MTIEELREQIERRLTDAREDVVRLQAALDALGHATGNTTPIDVAKPSRQLRPQAGGQRRRAARGTTRQAVLKVLAGGEAMTAGELAMATGLRRGTIAPELSKLVKTDELVKADRGYKTAAPANSTTSTTSTATANGADKSPAVLALGRELDAGLRTRT